jgi:hypothetical protein
MVRFRPSSFVAFVLCLAGAASGCAGTCADGGASDQAAQNDAAPLPTASKRRVLRPGQFVVPQPQPDAATP